MGFKIQRVESKRVDEFANMSDEELRQYVYGNKELDSYGATGVASTSRRNKEFSFS